MPVFGGHAGQLDAEVRDLLQTVEANKELSSEGVSKAVALADAEKQKSYALEEQDAPREKWLKPLSEACLLQAMVTAFRPGCKDDAAAVYELLDTQDHGSKLTGFIESEINAAVLEQARVAGESAKPVDAPLNPTLGTGR